MPSTVGYPAESITRAHADAVRNARILVDAGKSFRKRRETTWKRSERQYVGQQWAPGDLEDESADLVTVNVSFATVQTIQPYITGQEPRFYVEPFSKDATQLNASLQEALVNRIWTHRDVGAQSALRAATTDYVIYGDGWIKVTWAIEERSSGLGATTEVARIFVDRVSPWDVWMDPYASSISDARWVAQRIWKTKHEVESDDRYRIPADFVFTTRQWDEDDEGRDRTGQAVTEDDEWVVLIEFYDQERDIMYVYPERSGADDRPWQVVEGITCPLVPIPGYTIPGSPYHMGDLEQIYDLQHELNKTRSELMTHRRRNVAKVFVKTQAMSDDAMDALTSPIVGQAVPVDGDQPLQDLVQPMQLAPIASENYASSEQIMNDIREITGITEYQRGIAPEITRTATEASIMEGAANVKIKSKLAAIESATRAAGELILAIASEVFPQTDVDELAVWIGGERARKMNDMAAGEEASKALDAGDQEAAAAAADKIGTMSEAIITPTEEMFEGQYEIFVTQGSTEYRNPQAREERFKDMFFSLLGAQEGLVQAGVNVNYGALLRLWLESTDIPDVEQVLAPAPTSPPGISPTPGGPPPPGAGQMPPGGMSPELMAMMGGGGVPPMPQMGAPAPENTGMMPEMMPAPQ